MTTVSQIAVGIGIKVRELRALSAEVAAGKHYVVRRIRVRGRLRSVFQPQPYFDNVSKQLRHTLERIARYDVPVHVFGFVKGRSIRDNAMPHLAKDCVLTFDLKDFFESISAEQVRAALAEIGLEARAVDIVLPLVAPRGHLAMGLSTSPFLSNLVFRTTDDDLASLAKELGLALSRYADDITFSGVIDDPIADRIRAVLNQRGWTVNENKTRFMRKGRSQYVTGLSVSDARAPHSPRSLKRALRWRLHMIKKYGYEDYMDRLGGEARGHFPKALLGLAHYVSGLDPHFRDAAVEKWINAMPDYWPDPDEGFDP